jgi:hypothetical protein
LFLNRELVPVRKVSLVGWIVFALGSQKADVGVRDLFPKLLSLLVSLGAAEPFVLWVFAVVPFVVVVWFAFGAARGFEQLREQGVGGVNFARNAVLVRVTQSPRVSAPRVCVFINGVPALKFALFAFFPAFALNSFLLRHLFFCLFSGFKS